MDPERPTAMAVLRRTKHKSKRNVGTKDLYTRGKERKKEGRRGGADGTRGFGGDGPLMGVEEEHHGCRETQKGFAKRNQKKHTALSEP